MTACFCKCILINCDETGAISKNSADVVLLNSDLSAIDICLLSRKNARCETKLGVITYLQWFDFTFSSIGARCALDGCYWHVCSSILVITNSLRLLKL